MPTKTGHNVVTSITLKPGQYEKLARLVEAGAYRSMSEAVRAGVDLLAPEESEIVTRTDSLSEEGVPIETR